MSHQNLTTEFTELYMEKLFYFCLKRTGCSDEAQNLAQDIALNILTALHNGIVPGHFSAWVWQIARNRYSVWAEKKRRYTETMATSDICDFELPDNTTPILDELIHSEELSLLRRELAFINRDYRDIIVAYYIENRNIRDIAESLSLSNDAVKKRLQRARITLKEGMNMAREFGTKSYNPEHVSFSASGPQPSGLPWSAVQRSIPKNILLHASNNPSTTEELSMELGIALPYMEEEVNLLHKATLLEKTGDKYFTNFVILSKECRLDIYNALRRCSKERSQLLRELLTDILPDIRTLGIAKDTIDDNSIYWWLIPYSIDHFLVQTVKSSKEKCSNPPHRANGEEWGFVGYEHVELPENTNISHDGNGSKNCCFVQYRYPDYSLWNRCIHPSYEISLLLGDCITKKRKFSSFSTCESELWSAIDEKIAHMDNSGNIIPDILVIDKKREKEVKKRIEEHKNYTVLLHYFQEAYKEIKTIFLGYNHEILHQHIGYNIFMELYHTRMMAVHDLVDTGFLKLPENPDTSTVGMYLWLQ
ncbi:MAG: sigma-70 family RNA polymerase sigma factor [Lachnospiraceae bacterium]|nr:sigma-70 family RNA polymerase sigma factor [Lachnospiraceae bacterium]